MFHGFISYFYRKGDITFFLNLNQTAAAMKIHHICRLNNKSILSILNHVIDSMQREFILSFQTSRFFQLTSVNITMPHLTSANKQIFYVTVLDITFFSSFPIIQSWKHFYLQILFIYKLIQMLLLNY